MDAANKQFETPARTSKAAIAALVLGIFGVIIPVIAPVFGLGFGMLGLRVIRRSGGRRTGRGLAVAGIIMSGITLVMGTVVVSSVAAYGLSRHLSRPVFAETGGYKAVCQVGRGETSDQATLTQVCGVLKKRLDPRGGLGILVNPVDGQHLEICVPIVHSNQRRQPSTTGLLDDPDTLRRILRGSGVLEFRILAQAEEMGSEQASAYQQALADKGPLYASDNQYVWCALAWPENWQPNWGITGTFEGKAHVLCSNQPGQVLLHQVNGEWGLNKAYATDDQMGRRAVGFVFDAAGGSRFFQLTADNPDRQLCILLDNEVLSAPTINSPIRSTGIITSGSEGFTPAEVDEIVQILNAGTLPKPVRFLPESILWVNPE